MHDVSRRLLFGIGAAGVAATLTPTASFAAPTSSLDLEIDRIFEEAIRETHYPDDVRALYNDVLNERDQSISKSSLSDSAIAAQVGLIYTWFYGKGYLLAAELVAHSRSNKTVDSRYYPLGMNINPMRRSNTIKALLSASKSSGTSAFKSGPNILDTDGYYAIHKFSYTRIPVSGVQRIRLIDRYDYVDKDHYSGIQGAAVKVMYTAQQRGIIKPFKLDVYI